MSKNNNTWIYWIITLAVLSVSIPPYLYSPLGMDNATHLYFGNLFLHNVVPHKDYFVYLPIGTVLLFAIPIKLFGLSVVGFRVFDCFILLLALLGIYKTGKKIFDDWLAGFWASILYILFYFYRVSAWAGAGLKGHYLSICLIWGLYLFLTLDEKSISKRRMSNLFCGILCGTAFWIKGTSAFIYLGFMLLTFLREGKLKISRKTFKDVFALIMGGMIPSFLVFGYFFSKSALREMVYQTFFMSSSAFLLNWTFTVTKLLIVFNTFLGQVVLVITLLAVISIAIILTELIKNEETKLKKQNILIFSIFMVAAFLFVFVQNVFHGNHWYPFLFGNTILAGYAVSIFQQQINNYLQKVTHNKQARNLISACFICFLLLLCVIDNMTNNWIRFGQFLKDKSIENYYADFFSPSIVYQPLKCYQATKYIKQHTTEDDYVYVWGDELHIVGLLTDQKKIYTKYITLFPYMTTRNPEAQKELVDQLQRHKPKYFLATSFSLRTNLSFDELNEFIEINYDLEKRIDNIYIWRLKHNKNTNLNIHSG